MQKVIFNNKSGNSINVENVEEDRNKIYCYSINQELKFLTKSSGRYRWTNLILDGGTARGIHTDGWTNFKVAIMACSDLNVMIFRNQCEVLAYAKENL